CALSAMVGPPCPNLRRTIRLVAETMPFALTSASATLCRSTANPRPSSSLATVSAERSQSPGGLSEATLTISARKRASSSRCSRTKARIAFSTDMSSSLSAGEALDAHPVIGRDDVRRQALQQRFVIEIGVKVGQDRPARAHRLDFRQRVVEAEMRRVRTIAQRVDDPHLEPLEKPPAGLRNAFDVRRVGEGAKAEPERVDVAVVEVERRRFDCPALSLDPARAAGGEAQVGCDRRVRTTLCRLKYIGKGVADGQRRRLVHEHVDTPPGLLVERSQIVDPMRVIGVRVGDQYGIDVLDVGLDQLLAQIRSRIDERGRDAVRADAFDERGRAAAAVARIGRVARAPPLLDAGNARRGAAAEDGQAKAQGEAPPRSSFRKTRSVLARVAAASASGAIPFASATVRAVAARKAGSLRLPRWGTGAR